MTLPAITLPKVPLPFDIPVLLHPPIDHFLVAIPVVILLLEIINLVMKKKVISGLSFFLIFVTIVVAVAAYLSGITDAKTAFASLGEEARVELAEHKLLGTYILLASGVVFVFKFLSAITGKGLLKGLYLLVLMVFVAAIFKQGYEGGELVYEHGINVEKVSALHDEITDLKDDLSDAQEEQQSEEPVASTPEETPVTTPVMQEAAAPAEESAEQTEGMPEEIPQVEIATH